MKHRLIVAAFLFLLIGFLAIAQSGETAVLPVVDSPLNQATSLSNQSNQWQHMYNVLNQRTVRSVTLDPSNPDNMLAGAESNTVPVENTPVIPVDGSVYGSQDGGHHWQDVTGQIGRVNAVEYSPNVASDDTAFAIAGMIGQHGLVEGGIYRSQDNNITWTAVFTPNIHAFQTLAISPNFAADETVWASASSYSNAVGLYQSTNSGDNWSLIASGLNINLLAVSPNYAVDQTLFAGMGDDGIHRSQDGGVTWAKVLDVAYPTALAISPTYGSNPIVFAAARSELTGAAFMYRSVDGGTTWQELNPGIPLAVDGSPRLVSTMVYAVDGSLLVGVHYGAGGQAAVYRSLDGGESWQIVDDMLPTARIYDIDTKSTGAFDVFAATDTGIYYLEGVIENAVWQSNGPSGGRGAALAVSPNFADDGIAFTGEWYGDYQGSEAGSGSLKSTNFGQNWAVSAAGIREMGNETAVHDYAFSTNFATDQIVFAATGGGLFQSVDGGQHWVVNEALGQTPPSALNEVATAPDYADSGHIMAAKRLYGGLVVSQDYGQNWTVVTGNLVNSIAYSPAFAQDDTIFIAETDFGSARVAKSTDGGLTWTSAYSASVQSLAVSPNYAADQTIFAGGSALYKSTDGGLNWTIKAVTADSYRIEALAVSPNYMVDQTLFAGTDKGLYVSTDGGGSWQLVSGYENTQVLSLAISPEWPTHTVLLVGTQLGVYRLLTADLSKEETRQATDGLVDFLTTVMALAADGTLLLTGSSNHGLYSSENSGYSWLPYGLNGGASFTNVSALAVSPDYAVDQTVFAAYGSKYASYYRSTDAGATWESLYGIYNNASLALSPDFATDHTLFATGEDVGELKKSIDGGDTWQEIASWDKYRGGHLIALPPDYPGNGRLFIGTGQGFWYSPDNGATWQPAATGLVSSHYVKSLKVSPNFVVDQTLLAISSTSQQNAVYKSVDAGVNWIMVHQGQLGESLNDVAFSPNYAVDQMAYLITDHELYRSLDGGLNWKLVGSPQNQLTLHKVLVDKRGDVFVSSDVGVWRYGNVIVNGRFETPIAWDLPQTAVPADYSEQAAFSGQRSMRVGLDKEESRSGYSSARQTFTLPADLLAAELTFMLYPMTGEATAVSSQQIHHSDQVAAGDAQYVYLYDDSGVLLETLYWDLSNTQIWQKHTVDLTQYRGQALMLHFGVINDGQNGATGMYVDDVSIQMIDSRSLTNNVYLPVVMK